MSNVDPALPPHLLVVDDERWWLLRAEEALEEAGYRVTAVSDGAAALEQARAQSFALVVLDVMMPWMDGFEVCKTLRTEGVDTPCLFLMSPRADGPGLAFTDAGNRIYAIEKPRRAANLVPAVREVLSAPRR